MVVKTTMMCKTGEQFKCRTYEGKDCGQVMNGPEIPYSGDLEFFKRTMKFFQHFSETSL